MMEPVRELQKKYCRKALAFAIFAALFLFLAGFKPVGKGLVLGTVFSVLNFIIMGETLALRLAPGRRKAAIRSLGFIFLRYALMAVPLWAAIRFDQFDLFATIGGLFMIQAIIMTTHVYEHISMNRGKVS